VSTVAGAWAMVGSLWMVQLVQVPLHSTLARGHDDGTAPAW
jgi:hypothetical protein